jgi:hypothetical protein
VAGLAGCKTGTWSECVWGSVQSGCMCVPVCMIVLILMASACEDRRTCSMQVPVRHVTMALCGMVTGQHIFW